MEQFTQSIEVRWSDLDPNFHLRHSVYYDYAAYCRIAFFEKSGLSTHSMQEMQFGPILFREEAVFRKEIRMGDQLFIDMRLTKSKKDFSRWSIRHHLIKNSDVLAAIITVDGAWINTAIRKLATPPARLIELFQEMPRSEDFEWA